ncbi:MAG TPA: tetratricopeptide repeat protein [Candidatus Angelobacter sp.]|nr:tetratricopeptide repeat protein [Candidatus Angelobacter sp.]
MNLSSSRFRALVLFGITALTSAAIAQRGTSSSSNGSSRAIPPNRSNTTASIQPIFISGKVMLEGGGAIPEPVAIERVCNNVNRREGYTDSKGHFEFQLGTNSAFQDASESSGRITANPETHSGLSQEQRLMSMSGCEFRAVLAGYQSSVALVRTGDDTWQYDIGTIFLKRMGDAQGTTISVTSMGAPKNAMHAYEKAEKELQDKPADAEKELNKAVQIYPQFAAAWNLLGDIHRENKQLDQARTDYEHAVSADPQFVNPTYSLAVIAIHEKKWDEVGQYSDQVLKLNAMAFPMAYFFNAAANYNLQKFDAAEESAKKFKSLDTQNSHPDVRLLLSYIFSRKQDYAGAARELHDYLAIMPNATNAEELKAEAKRFEDLSASAKSQ